jgi:enoyl-CoA hydratase/carnithine racemase
MTAAGVVVRRHDPHVVEVVLDRPDALNAVSTSLAYELTGVLIALADDRETRAVVLSSSSARAFCVGADLKERATFSDDELLAQRPTIRSLFSALLDLPQPTIAAVAGFALGGGFELALSCDLIVADSTAVFGLPEVTVGLVPGGGGTQLLARRIGLGAATDLVLTGRKVEALEAVHLGIVNRPVISVGDESLALAAVIAANAPVAVQAAKRALAAGLGLPLGDALSLEDAAWRAAAVSADRREGIAAFVAKRSAVWSGE